MSTRGRYKLLARRNPRARADERTLYGVYDSVENRRVNFANKSFISRWWQIEDKWLARSLIREMNLGTAMTGQPRPKQHNRAILENQWVLENL